MHRFPFMADVGIVRVEGGLHPDSPDGSAILGGVPEVGGLYLACGLCSQGVPARIAPRRSPTKGELSHLGRLLPPQNSHLALLRERSSAPGDEQIQ